MTPSSCPRVTDFIPFFSHPRIGSSRYPRLSRGACCGRRGGGLRAAPVPLVRARTRRSARPRCATGSAPSPSTVELGCRRMNSEFNGRPEAAGASEAQFWRSMEELLPIFEREDIELALEPHPDDFVEDGNAAVDLIRGIDSPHVTYLYCAPHTFHMGGDIAGILRVRRRPGHPGAPRRHASTIAPRPACATSSTRPARRPRAPAPRHRPGRGRLRRAVRRPRRLEFDGILTTCVFAWEERAEESSRFMRAAIGGFVNALPGADRRLPSHRPRSRAGTRRLARWPATSDSRVSCGAQELVLLDHEPALVARPSRRASTAACDVGVAGPERAEDALVQHCRQIRRRAPATSLAAPPMRQSLTWTCRSSDGVVADRPGPGRRRRSGSGPVSRQRPTSDGSMPSASRSISSAVSM